ncbi:MAG: response regulator transcription factor [Flavobacteriaceae bacterium]|nr:response regulator transcription factor [Flavobacteriaceae bacterium]
MKNNKKVRCLIVDDEPLAIRLIVNHISKIDYMEVVATCNSAIKAFEILNNEDIDLLFSDIKMPNMTGIEFLRILKNPPKTIFTTAYRDYAIESYDLEVVDYLLKPITFERFMKAVDKYMRLNTVKNTPEPQQANIQGQKQYIIIKSGNKHHKIITQDIVYIESLKDYIKIHMSDKSSIVSKYKLGDISDELESHGFLRVHRSYIINTSKITAFTSNDIEVDSIEVPIGASFKDTTVIFLDKIKRVV